MMRIALFLLTNLAVMLVFGLVLSLTGIQSSSVQGLMIMAGLFGFGGAFVSLLMSKWMALRSVGGEVIERPRNETEYWLLETVRRQSQQVGSPCHKWLFIRHRILTPLRRGTSRCLSGGGQYRFIAKYEP